MLQPVIFDAIIAGIAAEFLVLAWLMRRGGLGRWILPLFWFLVSGALLMLAVRGALAGAGLAFIAAPLVLSLVTHALLLTSAYQRLR